MSPNYFGKAPLAKVIRFFGMAPLAKETNYFGMALPLFLPGRVSVLVCKSVRLLR